MTIRKALQEAAFHDMLIKKLIPLSNGIRVSLDSIIADLETPHVRLSACPLVGGTKANGKGNSKVVEDTLQYNDPWQKPAPANASCR